MMNETSEKDRVRYRGRYHAEYVRVAFGTDHQRAVHEALDSGSEKGWHVVGVEGGEPQCAAILYWDTEPPNFGRTNRARAWARSAHRANGGNAKGGNTDMSDEKARNPEDSLEIRRPVQAFDAASAAKRLREEKTYEDHGRSVLNLFHGSSLRAMLTAIAAGSRTGERRVAGPSTVQVLEGEVRFQAGEERHVLSAGGTLVLEGNVPYKAEALSDAAFLHTLVKPAEEDKSLPGSAHPTEPAEGRADLDLPGNLKGR